VRIKKIIKIMSFFQPLEWHYLLNRQFHTLHHISYYEIYDIAKL